LSTTRGVALSDRGSIFGFVSSAIGVAEGAGDDSDVAADPGELEMRIGGLSATCSLVFGLTFALVEAGRGSGLMGADLLKGQGLLDGDHDSDKMTYGDFSRTGITRDKVLYV